MATPKQLMSRVIKDEERESILQEYPEAKILYDEIDYFEKIKIVTTTISKIFLILSFVYFSMIGNIKFAFISFVINSMICFVYRERYTNKVNYIYDKIPIPSDLPQH